MSIELEQKVQSLQHSILFLQEQHAQTLAGLHGEIERLQEKCSELTFQLSLSSLDEPTQKISTTDGHSLKDQLQHEIRDLRKENEQLKSAGENREKRVRFLEEQLKGREQRFHDDLRNTQRQIGELQLELQNKSETIAYLTSQLRKKRRSSNTGTNDKDSTTEGLTNSRSPVPPADGSPSKRFNLRRRTVVSPAAANVAGMIEQSSSHQLNASIEVLESLLPKSNSTRFPSRYKQSIVDPARPAVGHSHVRRERDLKLHNRTKPSDYEDFLRLSESSDVVVKPSIDPLPPITTRSGRQLKEAPANLRRSNRLLRNNKIPTANAGGEVETLIKDTLSSPERQMVANLKHSRGK